MAKERGIPCTPHCANQSLLCVFTAHLLCAVPNRGAFMEFGIEPNWCADLYAPAFTVTDGAIMVPDEPGWGITLSPDWLAQAERQVSAVASAESLT
jgi:L-alanine-DL-glutamate epimerase-like enolase superfamily enzyme